MISATYRVIVKHVVVQMGLEFRHKLALSAGMPARKDKYECRVAVGG